jgi:hypothetical protein
MAGGSGVLEAETAATDGVGKMTGGTGDAVEAKGGEFEA